MENLSRYSKQYPDLILRIIEFFNAMKATSVINSLNVLSPKSLSDFVEHCIVDEGFYSLPNPRILAKICDKLCETGLDMSLSQRGIDELGNTYLCWLDDEWDSLSIFEKKQYIQRYECAVYGFTYIYEKYKSLIFPIIHHAHNGDISVCTGFFYHSGIATAKHCLEGAKQIDIMHIPKEQLENATIYISENPNMDIAYIELNRTIESISENAMIENLDFPEILEEVITMGHPKIPGYTDFQTAEKATVSALPHKKITATTGSVAAIARQIFMNENLFLITAKIKGGNSGGPVINKYGEVIGLVSEIPFADGNYDDLGYGTAIPIKFLNDVIKMQASTIQSIAFGNYEV